MKNKDTSWQFLEREPVLDAMERAGFDALYVVEDGVKNLAVFEPSQLKSAIGNSRTFDRESNDIRFRRGGEPASPTRQSKPSGKRFPPLRPAPDA